MPDRPLLATSDAALLDELLRLCAASGVEAQVAADLGAACAGWGKAPLVLLGDDLARDLLPAPPRRRGDLLLVARDLDAGAWDRAAALGAQSVVVLPDAQVWLLDRLSGYVHGPGADGRMVSVVGGRGGAGASTLACALAVTGARLADTLLLDMDPLGGGLDLVLGAEHLPGVRWPDLAGTRGRVDAAALGLALPRASGVALLSWDRGDAPATVTGDAAGSLLDAVRRSHDLVVADLPRGLDRAAEVVAAASAVVLLVVPAEVRAVAAAARVATAVGALAPDLRVVVRGPAPSGLTGDDVAAALGLPCAGWLRPERGLSESLERGEPPAGDGRGPLAELCARLLGGLGASRDGVRWAA